MCGQGQTDGERKQPMMDDGRQPTSHDAPEPTTYDGHRHQQFRYITSPGMDYDPGEIFVIHLHSMQDVHNTADWAK